MSLSWFQLFRHICRTTPLSVFFDRLLVLSHLYQRPHRSRLGRCATHGGCMDLIRCQVRSVCQITEVRVLDSGVRCHSSTPLGNLLNGRHGASYPLVRSGKISLPKSGPCFIHAQINMILPIEAGWLVSDVKCGTK